MLEFRTFGTIDVRSGSGERVAPLLDQPKRLALLAVLAARPADELLLREKLVSLLWPDCSPSAGRSSLNTTLSRLRRDLGAEVFRGTGTGTVGLSSAHFRSDAQQFLEALEADRPRRAAELYRGPFLEGFSLSGNRAFEEWVERRRSRFRRRAYRAALRAGEEARAGDDLEQATASFRRALEIDPVREEAATGLIRVLAERGHRSEALQVGQRFQEKRREELELPSSGEVRGLIDELRTPASEHGGEREAEPGTGVGDAPADGAPDAPHSGSGGGDPTVPPSGSRPAGDGSDAGWSGLVRGGAVVLLLVLLVGAGAFGAWTLLTPETEERTGSESTVAVLPFHVAGSADRSWEDGMVTVLSNSLDGAGILRAVADRTVLATWEQGESGRAGTSREEALSAARELGAGYAVVGSAVEVGSELRFTADLLQTESGRSVGRADVRGPPDSAAALADELARRVIGLLEERTDETVRRAEAASLNTHSLDALKAYLEGERHLRTGEAEAAMEAFREAIRADSSFALPYARVGLYGFWRDEDGGRATRRAYELSDALPTRDRRLIRALHLGQIEHRSLAAADSFRQLSRDYPDDPSVWSSLGEFLFHTNVARGLPEIEDAHTRAVALDPGHTAYYDHYVGPAFTLHHDSALAASRVEAMPETEWKRMYRIGLGLAFGDSVARERSLDRLDTARIHEPWLAFGPLEGPQDKHTLDRLLRRLLERDDLRTDAYGLLLFLNDLHRGQVERARADAERLDLPPTVTSCYFVLSMSLGYPIPDSVVRPHLGPASLPDEPSGTRLRCAAVYAIEQGEGDRAEALIREYRSAADTTGDGGGPAAGIEATVQEIRGLRAWRDGDLDRAARLLGRSNESFNAGAIWRGDLYRELGRPGRAEGWYRAAWRHPLAYLRLGRTYEELGRPEEAAASYRRFIAGWEEADDELRGRVREARERLRELPAAEGGAAGRR